VSRPSLTSVGCGWTPTARHGVRAGALASLDRSTMEELGQPPAPYLVTVGGQPLGQLAGGEGCVGAAWVEDGMLIVSPPTASLDGVEIAWRWEVEGPAPTGMRWVAPGSTHAIRFEQAWTLPDNTFRVYARALRVGDHGTVSLRVKDEAFELRERDGRMAAVARLTPPREPGWELEVSVPPDGSFALLHHLAIGVAPTTTYLLGMAETLHGSSVRVVGGRVEDVKHRPTFAAEPPAAAEPATGAARAEGYGRLRDGPARRAGRRGRQDKLTAEPVLAVGRDRGR
jgi:hypothetical protein